MGQSFSVHWVHLIWSTKYREKIITASLKWLLYNKIKQICEEKGYYLDYINGIEDHIHLLMGVKTTDSVSIMVKNIKGISQNWVNKEIKPEKYFGWQDGFAVISVSPSVVPKVRNYIKNQEKHHARKNIDFEAEITILETKATIIYP
jgi:putative transposase